MYFIEDKKDYKTNNGLNFGSLYAVLGSSLSPEALRPVGHSHATWRAGAKQQGERGWVWGHERYARQHVPPRTAVYGGAGGGGGLDLRYRADGWA